MIFLGASCLPSIKDNSNFMTFSLMVFNEGINQLIPLLLEVFMINPNQVITVNNDKRNNEPPQTLYNTEMNPELETDLRVLYY